MGDHFWPSIYPGIVVGLLYGLYAGGVVNAIVGSIAGFFGVLAAFVMFGSYLAGDGLMPLGVLVVFAIAAAIAAVALARRLSRHRNSPSGS